MVPLQPFSHLFIIFQIYKIMNIKTHPSLPQAPFSGLSHHGGGCSIILLAQRALRFTGGQEPPPHDNPGLITDSAAGNRAAHAGETAGGVGGGGSGRLGMLPWEKTSISCGLSHGPHASSATIIMNHTRIVRELGELLGGPPALLPLASPSPCAVTARECAGGWGVDVGS